MYIIDLMAPGSVAHVAGVTSRKRALEQLAGLLAAARPSLTANEIQTGLLARERIGTTTIGDGIALPRTRLSGCEAPAAAMVRLTDGVAFDAADEQPVDLLVGCLFPDTADNDAYRQLIDHLGAILTAAGAGARLRAAGDADALYQTLIALESESRPS